MTTCIICSDLDYILLEMCYKNMVSLTGLLTFDRCFEGLEVGGLDSISSCAELQSPHYLFRSRAKLSIIVVRVALK